MVCLFISAHPLFCAAAIMFYKILIKPVFFLFPPEQAHHIAMRMMQFSLVRWMMKILCSTKDKPVEALGFRFKNPVGLGAGFDKHATYVKEIEALGFGFTEIGTVTPLPQPGNDKPRLFRLPKDEALINRMGFNNVGADVVAARLRILRQHTSIIIGGNIGKNKNTPNEKAVDDYVICFEKLFDAVDYFVVNVSSPNTPGLRDLQDKKPLTEILLRLQQLNQQKENPKPILLKIAPDLTNLQLDDIISIVDETKIAGVIATNTTISRSDLNTEKHDVEKMGAGGLSGKPVRSRSTEVIRYLHKKSGGNLFIIGVGGIQTAAEAKEKLEAGATLVQLYTGFIYEGPMIVKKIVRKL